MRPPFAPDHRCSSGLAAAAGPRESVRGDGDEAGRESEMKTKSDRTQAGARAEIGAQQRSVAWNSGGRINWLIAAAVWRMEPEDLSILRG